MTLMTVALFTMSFVRIDTPLLLIMIVLFFMGSGMGLSMMSLNTHVLNATPKHLVSRVTPLTSASQQVIASFAVVGFTGYLSSGWHQTCQVSLLESPSGIPCCILCGHLFLAACIACMGLVLSLFLRKPEHITDESSFR